MSLRIPSETPRGGAVLLHGRGGTPESILPLAQLLPDGAFSIAAPGAEGGTWYPQRFLAPLSLNQPWLDRALAKVDAEVRRLEAQGVPRERIGLMGFSQGACLALEYVSRHPARYLFVGGLSGALIGPLETPRPAADLKATPVLLSCAELDAHIPREHVEASAAWFSTHGASVTLELHPGHQHTVFPSAMDWIRAQAGRS